MVQVEVVRGATGAKAVASTLCKRAVAMDATALVLAQHARSAVARFFVGSTVACTAATSTVPLIVVP